MSLTELSGILSQLPQPSHEDLLVGTASADDAAVYRITDDLAIIQTIDVFTPIVDTPYNYGQIAAANALSDVYAMGGRPLTALSFIGFPKKYVGLSEVVEILKGGSDKVQEAGALVVGGHSIMDPEVKYGLAVTGLIHPGSVITNTGARVGDRLILTKPVGTGILSTAIKQGKAGRDVENIITGIMSRLNRVPSEIMVKRGAHACTDVTGYGLLGHAYEMAAGSGVRIRIRYGSVPRIQDTLTFCRKGTIPGGSYTNREFLVSRTTFDGDFSEYEQLIMYDPQTSGGLLISAAENDAEAFVAALHEAGITEAVVIGEVVEGTSGTLEVVK